MITFFINGQCVAAILAEALNSSDEAIEAVTTAMATMAECAGEDDAAPLHMVAPDGTRFIFSNATRGWVQVS